MLTIHCPECGRSSRVPEDAPDDDGVVCCPRCARDFQLDDDPPPRRKRRRREPAPGFRCPYCGSREYPISKDVITTAGWVAFFVLLFFCFPLCFLGFLMTEKVQSCRDCGMRFN